MTSEALHVRVDAKTDRSAGPTACHPWKGNVGQHGTPTIYGVWNGKGTNASARKVWWEHMYGPCPANRNIFMTCGNRQCINEKHMTLRPRKDPETRFWSKVQKTEGCWIWTGYRNERGYGQFMNTWKTVTLAHRYSYELAYGKIEGHVPMHPEFEKVVMHTCDNPACVRPDHLRVGTDMENMRDMIAKGRAGWQNGKGGRGARSTIPTETRAAIRSRRVGGETYRAIADSLGMAESTVWNIVNLQRDTHGNGKSEDGT